MKRCGDCNARYGTAHATNCPKYLESLYKRIAELEAENKRLELDRDDWRGRYDALYGNGPLYRLEAENAKLRKEVEDE